jgi:hypothetical protein
VRNVVQVQFESQGIRHLRVAWACGLVPVDGCNEEVGSFGIDTDGGIDLHFHARRYSLPSSLTDTGNADLGLAPVPGCAPVLGCPAAPPAPASASASEVLCAAHAISRQAAAITTTAISQRIVLVFYYGGGRSHFI